MEKFGGDSPFLIYLSRPLHLFAAQTGIAAAEALAHIEVRFTEEISWADP